MYIANLSCELELDKLFGLAANEPTIILGDFNARHPDWNDPSTPSAHRIDDTGRHIKLLLDSFPDVSLLNARQATHTKGGVLDLVFLSTSLLSTADWIIHPFLTSDHLATITNLPLPPPAIRWNLNKADWSWFTQILEDWATQYTAATELPQLEQDFTTAIKEAADIAIPKTATIYHSHKDSWFYCERIQELKRRMHLFRNLLRKTNSPEIHESFRTLRGLVNCKILEIRNQAWLTWCENNTQGIVG